MVSHGRLSVSTVCAAPSARGAATEHNFKFPPYHYLWQNSLSKAKTWRCPDADSSDSVRIIRGQRWARLRKLGSWTPSACVYYAPQSTQVCTHICSLHSSTATKCQRLISLLSRSSIISRWDQTRSLQTQESTSSGRCFIQAARCGAWVLWCTPARYRAARSVLRGGNGERFMDFRGNIKESASTCWNIEQSSMWSSVVYGPQQTFIPRESKQWTRW